MFTAEDPTFRIEGVEWTDRRAIALRAALDAEVGPRYAGRVDFDPSTQAGRRAAFAVDPASLRGTYLAIGADDVPLGHAALRRLEIGGVLEWELKRLITVPEARGRGVATALVSAVEAEAASDGARRVILQTGDRQPEALALYAKLGYRPIPAYPPYAGVIAEGLSFARDLAARPDGGQGSSPSS